MTNKDDLISVLDGLADAFNAHDIDKIMAYFDDDCSLGMPRGPEPHGSRYTGLDNVRRGLLARFESTPDVHYGDVKHFVDGDMGVSKWLLTGTTPGGEKIEVRGCDFYTFRNGKIVRKAHIGRLSGNAPISIDGPFPSFVPQRRKVAMWRWPNSARTSRKVALWPDPDMPSGQGSSG